MGESLIGRLKGVLAKKPAAETAATATDQPARDQPAPDRPMAATPEPVLDRTAAAQCAGPAVIRQDPLLPSPASTRDAGEADRLVPIEFRALVPNEAAAREIAEVSRRGSDCIDASSGP